MAPGRLFVSTGPLSVEQCSEMICKLREAKNEAEKVTSADVQAVSRLGALAAPRGDHVVGSASAATTSVAPALTS